MGQTHHVATTWASGMVITAARLNNLEAQYAEAVANFPACQIGTFYRNGDVGVGANSDQTINWTEETDDDAVFSVSGAYVLLPGAGLYSVLLRTTWQNFGASSKTGEAKIQLYDSTPTLKATLDTRGIQSTNGFGLSILNFATFHVPSTITGPRTVVTVRNSASPGGGTLTGSTSATWLHFVRWNRA